MVFSFSLLKIARLILPPLGQSDLYRITLQESYTNILCLTAKKFPWASVFGLEMRPKQFYSGAVEFVSKFFFVYTGCLEFEWRVGEFSWWLWSVTMFIWIRWLKGEYRFRGKYSFHFQMCSLSISPTFSFKIDLTHMFWFRNRTRDEVTILSLTSYCISEKELPEHHVEFKKVISTVCMLLAAMYHRF